MAIDRPPFWSASIQWCPSTPGIRLGGIALMVLTLALSGCKPAAPKIAQSTADSEPTAAEPPSPQFQPETYEATAEQLLSARLTDEEAADGWVRLFDGHTLFGWEITGKANFRVQDGSIVVDQGAPCLMCTSTTWNDFELTLEFNADAETNSGVFVRTPVGPDDPEIDCYEINIAPDDNPFPTGSIVKRAKVESKTAGEQTPGKWRSMTIVVQGQDVTVSLGDKVVCQYSDPVKLSAHRIGLQHRSGRVAFRDIRIKPLGLQPMLDKELSQWTKYPDMPGEFSINEDGDLHVVGGSTQLETKQTYDDFFMLAQYKIEDREMNSGIFFRCIPGDKMMGYECQVNNGYQDDSRLSPLDWGTGGIFKRQAARVIAGDDGQWSTVLLHAAENKISAWVNGVQVSDWEDTRDANENPRRGLRTEAGTIMIQGHDPKTDLLFRNLQISRLSTQSN